MKRALITGVTGQDGSYLSEWLLLQGYEVHGIVRRSSSFNTDRIDHLYEDPHSDQVRFYLHYGDLADGAALNRLMSEVLPHEIYNLAAQSHVRVSFDQPEYTADIDGLGTLRLLEAARELRSKGHDIKFYQAGTSEMFGSTPPPQSELTPFHPRSPYAVAKVYGYWQTINYREAYGLFACNGILFNHESERRGETFVTRKITRAACRIKLGLQEKLFLGNLSAARDWGYAPDFVRAMWLMLQQDKPDDFIIATGEMHTVQGFLDRVFGMLDLDWHKHVLIDPRYFRPAEVDALRGDASKAQRVLGWEAEVGFDELVRRMVEHDLRLANQERILKDAGHTVPERGAASV